MKKEYYPPTYEQIHPDDTGELYKKEKLDRRTNEGKSRELARQFMEYIYRDGVTLHKEHPISELPDFIRDNIIYADTLIEKPGHKTTWKIEEAYPPDGDRTDFLTEIRVLFWETNLSTNVRKLFDILVIPITSPLQQAKADTVITERYEQEVQRRESFVDFAIAHSSEEISGHTWQQIDEYLRHGFFVRLSELPTDGYAIVSPLPENKNGFIVRLFDAERNQIDIAALDFDNPSWE